MGTSSITKELHFPVIVPSGRNDTVVAAGTGGEGVEKKGNWAQLSRYGESKASDCESHGTSHGGTEVRFVPVVGSWG